MIGSKSCEGHCGGRHLTSRQATILELTAAGFTADQVARHLGVVRNTIEDHLRVMRARTRTRNCPELVAWAFAAGIFLPGSWPPRLSGRTCICPPGEPEGSSLPRAEPGAGRLPIRG